jgi:hypothetical protein
VPSDCKNALLCQFSIQPLLVFFLPIGQPTTSKSWGIGVYGRLGRSRCCYMCRDLSYGDSRGLAKAKAAFLVPVETLLCMAVVSAENFA